MAVKSTDIEQAIPAKRAVAQKSGAFPRVVIVGAGISGLCLAIRLKLAGIQNITILEKSHDVGGTWLDNSYPGCGCDVPSILYSYSFAPKYDWSRKFAPQSEILEYFQDCADRFAIRPQIRFGTAVTSASFDEATSTWRIQTDQREELIADIFVSAVGQLSLPKTPAIEGLESFRGATFHTARWNHGFDVTGRDLAVVGNGASAIQLIPKVAATARKVYVFQRSPNWIARRHDYAYPHWMHRVFRWIPGAAKLHRFEIYLGWEWRILLYKRKGLLNKGFTRWLRYWMKRKVPAALWPDVIPRYPAGCKRVLLSNDYLESLHRDNVKLVTQDIQRIVPEGIITSAGLTPVDAIIFATGFETSKFLYPMTITGRDGEKLNELWQARPRTYLGMFCPGFPNFFMLYGPNTNLGHNSIIFMVECQVNYILCCLQAMTRAGCKTIEVREEAVESFDKSLQTRLREKVWHGYVASWYKTADGHIINNWCGSTIDYWRKTRKPDFTSFHFGKPTLASGPPVEANVG